MLDLGATIGGDAQHLVALAIMGGAMARVLFDLERPTVGLLNIGVEEVKGLEEVREAAELLRAMNLPQLDYIGFVEGDDIGKGTVDVDRDRGLHRQHRAEDRRRNGAADLANICATPWPARWRSPIGYLLARQAFQALRDKMDPRKFNGGVLLGLNGIVVKSHGGTDAEGFAYAVDVGYEMVRCDLAGQDQSDAHRDGSPPPARRAGALYRDCTSFGRARRAAPICRGKILTNDDLAERIDTSDEWITQRTGIRQRHIAADGEITSDLAIQRRAGGARRAGVDAQSIDLIVLATSTPDNTFPGDRGRGAERARHPSWRRLRHAGGVLRLRLRDRHRRQFPAHAAQFKRALVIGAETFSRILDWTDRATCVLFGDGAGAVVLEAEPQPGTPRPRHPDDPSALGRPPQGQALCRRRSVVDRRRSATCAWRAARSSSTRSA